ncbi:MAG TPA: hypothetical protein VLB85_05835 [Acidimicrobiia bacterium]|nr:hypothetical protein [Acidimicrobiia bacterium]
MAIHIDETGNTTTSDECRHALQTVGRIGVIACGQCGLLEFFGARGPLDPAEGIAGLFGNFDLVGPLPAVGAPARRVLVYRPARGRKAALAVLPEGVWMRAATDLWIASDGRVLMLATPDDLMVDNLTRGA